jgi:hypothetical protein
MSDLALKSSISNPQWYVALILLFPLLFSSCQTDHPPSISAAPSTPTSAPPTTAPDTPSPAPPTVTPTPIKGKSIISVPQGKPLAVDGRLSPDEWANALVEPFSDGSKLFLMHSDGYLYLGIRASTPGMIGANIFIDRSGEIAVLHTSAALGTAVYETENGSWQQSQDFDWRCRRTDNSEAALTERDAFLQEEHWLAANSRMGTPNELEYQIEMAGETLRLALTFIRASTPDEKTSWPNNLDDDFTKPTLGGLPAQMHFEPNKWATIEASNE